MKLTQKTNSLTQRVLIYGPPKSGKTLLAAKLAEKFNLIWFDCENGWATLKQLPLNWQNRIELISIPDSRTFPIAAETWLKVVKGTSCSICETHGKVECALCKKENKQETRVQLAGTPSDTIVVFDSLTQLTNSLISHITKAQPDDYKLMLDDWGHLKSLIDKFLSQIQAAGYNVVCITHEEEVTMEDGRKRLVPSSGSSKSSMNTAKYFDTVVYCEMKNKKHSFGSSTTYSMNAVTGSRTSVELEKSDIPSLLSIFTLPTSIPASTPTSKEDTQEAQKIVVEEKVVEEKKQEVDKTPGQLALSNLRNLQTNLLNSKGK